MRLIDAYALEEQFGTSDEDIIAKEIINEAPTIDAAPQWISVKDRLPEDERLVLGLMLGKFCFVGSCRPSDKTWFCATQSAAHPCKKEVTHWMPLPEPPKEEKDGN